MPKAVKSDAENRVRISSDLSKNFFVEAGAGSGKTRSLVYRMIGLIQQGCAKIENIAAVTFTRKAAADLRGRFQIKLEKCLEDPSIQAGERENVRDALSNLEKVFIGTIHSFCAKLLRERPVEAGIDPAFEEIDEDENAAYAEEVWNEYVEKNGFENNKIIGWIQDNGISPEDLRGIFLKCIDYTDVELVTKECEKPDFTGEKEYVKEVLEKIRHKMPTKEPEKGWDTLQDIVVRARRLMNFGYLGYDRRFVTLLNLLKREPKVVKNRWPDETADECLSLYHEFRKNTVLPAIKEWNEYLHKPLMGFIGEGVRYYENWRRERSILNYQDLLTVTAGLLKNSAEIRKYFKEQITHLMVDEFQDTDPIQAEIILLLTGDDDSIDDWRKVRPRLGTLFVVGDPKQSIYRFRRADIDIYNRVKQLFKRSGGEILDLTSNFRSLPKIGMLADDVFQSVFPEGDTEYQAKFAPLVTQRNEEKKFSSGILINEISKVRGNYGSEIARVDAERIANWIRYAVNGGIRIQRTPEEKEAGLSEIPNYGDFMIITRIKKRLPAYANALELLGIPYELSGGKSFGQSKELMGIYTVLKAAADPEDQVALVAALRGMYFGISDDILYKFKKAGGCFSYFSNTPKGFEMIYNSFERLKEYREMVLSYSAVTATEKIIESLGVIPLAVSKEMGSTRAGNILKAVELIRKTQADQIGSFSELIENLKRYFTSRMAEEMGLFPGTSKAVRIMNLHKAKGLEASIVFLADPMGALKEQNPVMHIRRTDDGAKGYFIIERRIGEYLSEELGVPPRWDEQKQNEIQYNKAERKRHEYVAVTRAKNIMIISTYYEGTRETAWKSLYKYLGNADKLEVVNAGQMREKEKFEITSEEWEREKQRINDRMHDMCAHSYDISTVTAEAKDDTVFRGGVDGGTNWGEIVHKALEVCGRGKREMLKMIAKNWLTAYDRPHTDMDRLLRTVDGVMNSDMWARVTASKVKYFEIPFAVKEKDVILTGAIDLVFKEGNKWVIVDYKTDDFEKDMNRKKSYEKQLHLYAKYWEKITGEKVKEVRLYKV